MEKEHFRKLLKSSSPAKYPDKILDAALGLVDLQYEKANLAKQIVELVRANETDQALTLMDSYTGHAYPIDGEFYYWKKVVLYVRCLLELTLLKDEDKPLNRDAIETIIYDWEVSVPRDKSLVYWEDNLSPWLIFLLAVELRKEGLNYMILYHYATEWDVQWIDQKGPYTPEQVEVLLFAIREIIWKKDRKMAYKKLIQALAEQGELQQAKNIAADYQINLKKILKKKKRIPDAGLSEFYSAWKNDSGLEQEQPDPIRKVFGLFRLAIALQENGSKVEAEEKLHNAFKLICTIKDQSIRNEALKKLSRLYARLDNAERSLAVCKYIDDIRIKDETCNENCHIFALKDQVRESVSFVDVMLETPVGSITIIDRKEEISRQIIRLYSMGRFGDGLYLLDFLPDESERNLTLLKTVKMLLTLEKVQDALTLAEHIPGKEFSAAALTEIAYVYVKAGKSDEAEELLKQSLSMTESFDEEYDKSGIMERIALGYSILGKFEKAVHVMKKFHEDNTGKRLNEGNVAQMSHLYKNMMETATEEQMNILINLADNQVVRNRIRLYLALKIAKEGKADEAMTIWKNLMKKDMELYENELIHELINQGRMEEIVNLMNIVTLKEKKDATFSSIAMSLAEKGDTDNAFATAKKIRHHYYKLTALCALAEVYIKNDQYDLALELKPMIPPKYADDFLADLATFLARNINPDKHDQTAQEIFALITQIKNKPDSTLQLKRIAISLIQRECFRLAEDVGLSISNINSRHEMWKLRGYLIAKEKGVDEAFLLASKFEHEETIHYFKKGVIKYCLQLNSFEKVPAIIKEISGDTETIELLLKHVAINELFQGNPDPETLQRMNRSLNIQWAIDIAEAMKTKKPKHLLSAPDDEDDGSDDYFRYLRAWAKR